MARYETLSWASALWLEIEFYDPAYPLARLNLLPPGGGDADGPAVRAARRIADEWVAMIAAIRRRESARQNADGAGAP